MIGPRCAMQWVMNRLGANVRPLELILFVTQRCNLRCAHCFLSEYESNPAKDLPLHRVEALARDLPGLVVLMITGGEPFMRDDLPEVIRAFSLRSRPRVISIATNGVLSNRIVPALESILGSPGFVSQLVVTLSFEGVGQDHDTNRGRKGAYRNALETAHEVRRLQTRFPSLECGANLTLLPANEGTILDAARELQSLGVFSFLTQNIYRENRPRSACAQGAMESYRRLANLALEPSRTFRMGGNPVLGAWHRLKERYQAHAILKTCQQQAYSGIPCEAGRGIGVVYSDGSVAPCELLPADWGSLHTQPLLEIWNNPKNRQFSNRLRHEKCFCTHECFLSASINLQVRPMLTCLAWNMRNRNTL